MNEAYKHGDVKILVVIVDRRQERMVAEILGAERVPFHFITLAEGTAGSEIIAFLGLDSIDKSFICSMAPAYRIRELLEVVSAKLQLSKPGKGIAFTTPISSINNSALAVLMKPTETDAINESGEDKLENANCESKYDLIVSVVNHGHTSDVMESARSAGATGGTVLHGRKLALEGDAKFLGITPQLEKDIVAILSVHEKKNDIMRAITKNCGFNTEARGVIFSLQVDEMEGLGKMREAGE
jgi:hypothetical protein